MYKKEKRKEKSTGMRPTKNPEGEEEEERGEEE